MTATENLVRVWDSGYDKECGWSQECKVNKR